MKRETGRVEIASGYEKAVTRSRQSIERNTRLLEVTVPIGVIRSLATVRGLPTSRAARGSAPVWGVAPPPGPMLGRRERGLLAAIALVLAACLVVAVI